MTILWFDNTDTESKAIVKYIKTGASASTHKERGEVSKTYFDAQ